MIKYFSQYKNIYILILFLGAAIGFNAQSQGLTPNNQPSTSFWENVRYGGSLGLSFGSGYFTGTLAPSAIYDFNELFSTGAGVSFAYASQDNFNATSYGGSIIGMVRPVRQLQLSAEYEQLNITRNYKYIDGNDREQYWVPGLFLGLGYNTGPVVTGIRYNVLHDSTRSFYSNAFMPFVSIYF